MKRQILPVDSSCEFDQALSDKSLMALRTRAESQKTYASRPIDLDILKKPITVKAALPDKKWLEILVLSLLKAYTVAMAIVLYLKISSWF